MLFHEIYNVYFSTVTAILQEAVQKKLTRESLQQIIQEKAFGESMLSIPQALQKKWPLLKEDLSTPIQHKPQRPLTILEKRWLKTLLADPRMQLFDLDDQEKQGLEKVEPLFNWQDIVYYDRYNDGDPFTSPQYIANFRQLLQALFQQQTVLITYKKRADTIIKLRFRPRYLEYSPKDDKFRVIGEGSCFLTTLNVAKIHSVQPVTPAKQLKVKPTAARQKTLVFLLDDKRSTLDRALLHFSHFQKQTTKIAAGSYQVTLQYAPNDEAELLIRILSFGPSLQVLEPESMLKKIREKLSRQLYWQYHN